MVERSASKTLDRRAEAVLEVQAAHLAVRDHIQPDAFLQAHGAAHRLVLHHAQRFRGQLPVVEADARFPEARRAQQAADDVGTDGLQIGHCGSPL